MSIKNVRHVFKSSTPVTRHHDPDNRIFQVTTVMNGRQENLHTEDRGWTTSESRPMQQSAHSVLSITLQPGPLLPSEVAPIIRIDYPENVNAISQNPSRCYRFDSVAQSFRRLTQPREARL